MVNFMRALIRLTADTRGVTALEYALIAALVAGAMVLAVTAVGTNVSGTFNSLAGSI